MWTMQLYSAHDGIWLHVKEEEERGGSFIQSFVVRISDSRPDVINKLRALADAKVDFCAEAALKEVGS